MGLDVPVFRGSGPCFRFDRTRYQDLHRCRASESYSIRYEPGIVTAIADDIPDNGRTDIGFSRRGEQKNGFDLRKLPVGMGDGFLKLKIRRVA